jgi:hypothetical protein
MDPEKQHRWKLPAPAPKRWSHPTGALQDAAVADALIIGNSTRASIL